MEIAKPLSESRGLCGNTPHPIAGAALERIGIAFTNGERQGLLFPWCNMVQRVKSDEGRLLQSRTLSVFLWQHRTVYGIWKLELKI